MVLGTMFDSKSDWNGYANSSNMESDKMSNPYAPSARRTIAVASRSKEPLTSSGSLFPAQRRNPRSGTIATSSTTPLIASNGEFNADSKKDLADAIGALHRLVNGGQVVKAHVKSTEDLRKEKADRERVLAEALADRSGQKFQALGEVMGDEVWETLGREGFARNSLLIKPLGKGEVGRLRIRKKDVMGFFATANANAVASQIRQYYVYPPEYYLLAGVLIEDREIEQSSGDILDDKYQDALEQIMVKEDQVWRRLARAAAPVKNDLFVFNTFTPTVFTTMRTQVASWGLPVSTMIMSFDIWNDIIADSGFSGWFDPVSKHEIVLEGSIGSIQGVKLVTDGFRYDTLKVLGQGEVYMCASPQTLGGITQRKELMTQSIDRYNQMRPERGWFMEQIEGMAFTNPAAIAMGNRA